MQTVLIVIHLIVTISLISVILVQKSESGMGLGGGSSMGGLLSSRGTANLLTRTTAVLAALFFSTSLALAILANHQKPHSIVDQVVKDQGPVDLKPKAQQEKKAQQPSIPQKDPKAH